VGALALLFTWMAAAGRPTHPFDRRWTGWSAWRNIRSGELPGWKRWRGPYTPERVGMLSMLCAVVVFGAHSLVDWTWYVPGNACVALLFAGWLAGRGPLVPAKSNAPAGDAAEDGARSDGAGDEQAPAGARATLGRLRPAALRELGPARLAVAGAIVIAALLAAWSQLQPQRSEDARQDALALLARNPRAALASANTAVSRDPLSAEARFTLAHVQQTLGEPLRARATLQRAVRMQPSNPQTWFELGRFNLHRDPRAAAEQLQAAIYLNPQSISPEALAKDRQSIELHNYYVEALRGIAATRTAPKIVRVRPGRAAHGRRAPSR